MHTSHTSIQYIAALEETNIYINNNDMCANVYCYKDLENGINRFSSRVCDLSRKQEVS